MIVAFTGHRPERLASKLVSVDNAIVKFLTETKPDMVISGMAQGVDMIAASNAYQLGIPFTAAVPWVGHAGNWSAVHRELYLEWCEKATALHVVSDTDVYKPWVYQKRDEWMVDNCEMLVAIWDGVEAGGTWNTIKYARHIGRVIRYLEWL